MMLDTVLLVAAAICFVLAAFDVFEDRVHIGWIGLFLWVLTALI